MITLQWTYDDSADAKAEGWDVFEGGDRFHIGRVDAEPKFQSDSAAFMHVVQKALAGDHRAIKAIVICGVADPVWLASDLSCASQPAQVTCLGPDGEPTARYSTLPLATHPAFSPIGGPDALLMYFQVLRSAVADLLEWHAKMGLEVVFNGAVDRARRLMDTIRKVDA